MPGRRDFVPDGIGGAMRLFTVPDDGFVILCLLL
ncbi:hypothetical protein K2D_19300 [Planctomycetes bacterium K2D]|uniref:Uncharacterized protein n=1 Tax=Botrimarina mediterranea TaxID=2528022 RepID=A0A518K7J6_9BACT|nr:hypothetical protein Spa11_19530 [Botrimarina mediterranea]QDV78323.1 hypothetical protein K2D_19300 [Planctomycetes bacterium K2D]